MMISSLETTRTDVGVIGQYEPIRFVGFPYLVMGMIVALVQSAGIIIFVPKFIINSKDHF